MTFAILGANTAVSAGEFSIDNSLRFNDGDSAYLNRTPASASNRTTWTWSAWIKRSAISTGNFQTLWNAGSGEADDIRLTITNNDQIIFGTDATTFLLTSQLFRDVSAWYHIVFAFDTTQGTASDRAKLYINGSLVSSFSTDNRASLSGSYAYNNTVGHGIGRQAYAGSTYYDGYMAEINFIDGQQLTPTDFGEFDEDSGIWKPIRYSGTYGTNGFKLDFSDSGSLGADSSGNGNNWTPTNLASTDQVLDTPINNFATGNPLMNNYWIRTLGVATGSQGNLEWSSGASDTKVGATISTAGGKWYAEMRVNSLGSISALVSDDDANVFEIGYNQAGNRQFNRATPVSYGASYGAGDVIGFAVDQDNNQVTFYKNGASQGTLTNTFVGDAFFIGAFIYNGNVTFNFGQDSTFAGRETATSNTDENGYGEFHHSVPSGYLALCTQNLATELSPTIADINQHFNIVLYSGNGGTNRSITGMGFQPDWLWHKDRNASASWSIVDSTRGTNASLPTDGTGGEQAMPSFVSFDSDGFTVTQDASTSPNWNVAGNTKVVYGLKANGGTTSTNTDGSISSTVQANTTAGFSIVTYIGNETFNATVGHGLGKTPKVVFVRERENLTFWLFFTTALDGTLDFFFFNRSDAKRDLTQTLPTSSVFSLGSYIYDNKIGAEFIGYCFAEIEGYNKFGSYTGNGSTDGTFVYTGFRPAFIMIKRAVGGTGSWQIYDTSRDTFNETSKRLQVNTSGGELSASYTIIDILSNGFKTRNTSSNTNTSGSQYFYMVFAENPFVSSTGIPLTAR